MPNAVNVPSREPNPMRTSTAVDLSLTSAQHRVAAVLAEVHDATVIEITARADVSKSSVAKALALLERVGAAIRTVREEDGVREADLWSPGPTLGPLLVTVGADGPGLDPGEAVEEPDEPTVAALAPVADVDATERSTSSTRHAAQADGVSEGEPEPEHVATPPDGSDPAAEGVAVVAPEPAEPAPDGRAGRLAPGELAAMVAAVLVAHPEIEYTPTMLSHLLCGRSAGAIHNVLEKMIKTGTAMRTSDKPKRYRHAVADATNPA